MDFLGVPDLNPAHWVANLRQKVMGHPFVYEKVRPFVIGGLDLSPAYANLANSADDVVLDIGCGTGDALNYLGGFRAYYGFDTDAAAVAHARGRFGQRPNVQYFEREATAADFEQLRPTRVMMAGLLHHLDDATAVNLLRTCAGTPSVRRVATQDVIYVDGAHFSNVLAFFDRGKFVRREPQYHALVQQAGLRVVKSEIVKSHPENGRALLFLMALDPIRV